MDNLLESLLSGKFQTKTRDRFNMHCSWCNAGMAAEIAEFVIITDHDIFGTCSDECHEMLLEDVEDEPEYYGNELQERELND